MARRTRSRPLRESRRNSGPRTRNAASSTGLIESCRLDSLATPARSRSDPSSPASTRPMPAARSPRVLRIRAGRVEQGEGLLRRGQAAGRVAQVEAGVDGLGVAGDRGRRLGVGRGLEKHVAGLVERARPGKDHPAQPAGPGLDAGGGIPGRGPVEQLDRVAGITGAPGAVAGGHESLGGRRRVQRQRRGPLGGRGGDRVRGAVGRPAGHAVHLLGHGLVRSKHRLGPMPGPPVRVSGADRARDEAVQLAAAAGRGGPVQP